MIPLRLARVAEEFWALAQPADRFPRDMEEAVAWALPLALVRLPRLRPHAALRWLAEQRVDGAALLPDLRAGANRRLYGALFAYAGSGYAFVDGADPVDESRLTVAHEAAHFVLDYLLPRRRTVAALGAPVADVLDGLRAATTDERIFAVLAGVDLEVYTQLFARDSSGASLCGGTGVAELDADRLALELIAPADLALARWQAGRPGERAPLAALATLLADEFGLPRPAAARYARRLAGAAGRGEPFANWLGVPAAPEREEHG